MKKYILLIAITILGQCAMAQRFDAAVWAGMNMCQIDGDNSGRYNHLGLHAAINTSFSLTDNEDGPFRMLVELAYTQKGSFVQNINKTIDLQYVEVPVMATLKLGGIRLGAGLAPGILIGSKVTEGGVEDYDESANYRTMDLLPVVGEISWSKNHISVYARYENSMRSIAKESGSGTYRIFRSNIGVFSRLVTFGLGYRL